MALESPLLTSPGNLMSPFSPYTDFSMSPSSPAQTQSPRFKMTTRSSGDSSSLRPYSIDDGLSPNGIHLSSPSDMVGPSPVTSNGTDTTEIEDEGEDLQAGELSPPEFSGSSNSNHTMKRLSTNVPDHFRTSLDNESVSVIHAPIGYGNFALKETAPVSPPRASDRSTPTPYQQHENLSTPSSIRVDLEVPKDRVGYYNAPNYDTSDANQITQPSPVSPPPISTDIPFVKYGLENATPRAQTRQEVEALLYRPNSTHSSLEGIPEEQREEDDFDLRTVQTADEQVNALKTALHECWTLCNTLASLSSNHREQVFNYSGTRDAHEMAWKCCWKLCQKLYDSRDEDHDIHVRPTLDLCRDFCQALFDVRQRKDEVADSVLRVSFELNNHLFNTHDRNLPELFRERTLDFYITLCHRLMKQRNELAAETDALLRACWGLAEMLFSLRQNKREGKAADEELLGSAVQACWELCDLFRHGWTQVRPDRGTPRPQQTTFTQISDQMSRSSHTRTPSLSSFPDIHEEERAIVESASTPYPETPTTQFEDTPISPEESSPNIPSVMIVGTDSTRAGQARWSSNNSTLSSYSQGSSNHSSSTITSQNGEDANLTRLKILILKAAMNVGFTRGTPTSSGPNKSDPPALQNFVKSLQPGTFGTLPSHANLLASYRTLVLSDSTFKSASTLPSVGKKASAIDVASSVRWMARSGRYPFLKDLFKLVFGFHVEEADSRKHVSITV